MRLSLLVLPLGLLLFASCSPKIGGKETNLLWADEFAGHEPPNGDKWAYDLGGNGWGNNELQYYTARPENAYLLSGKLIIEARKETFGGHEYTSARLVTRNKQTWTHKRIAVRAKLPSGRGTWPAIWMLGENIKEVGWPMCGEIDIMEHVGYQPDSVFGTVHTKAFNHVVGTQDGGAAAAADLETNFHVYSIDWHTDRIEFRLDGKIYHTFRKRPNATVEEWPFDQPHYLLLNLAVGGDWGGAKGVDETIWPQRLEVDWVRVYKL